jgi:hypothetical protein
VQRSPPNIKLTSSDRQLVPKVAGMVRFERSLHCSDAVPARAPSLTCGISADDMVLIATRLLVQASSWPSLLVSVIRKYSSHAREGADGSLMLLRTWTVTGPLPMAPCAGGTEGDFWRGQTKESNIMNK